MKTVLAIEPGYTGVRACLGTEDSGRPVVLRSWAFPSDGCDFSTMEGEGGASPSVVVIPGGIYEPREPGSYALSRKMAADALRVDDRHPRNRMTVQALEYCERRGVSGVALEPMASASLLPEASLAGIKSHVRRGVYYAMPQRQAWDRVKVARGLPPEASGVTAYLGEECSVSSHFGETVVDTSDPVFGEGPFGFTAAGTLPAVGFLTYLAGHPMENPTGPLKLEAGLFAYAKVESLDELLSKIAEGDDDAFSAVSAMGYQVAKEIGRQVVALSGTVQAIVLCGPGACVEPLCRRIITLVEKWAPVVSHTEKTLDLLLAGGTRILKGEVPKEY